MTVTEAYGEVSGSVGVELRVVVLFFIVEGRWLCYYRWYAVSIDVHEADHG